MMTHFDRLCIPVESDGAPGENEDVSLFSTEGLQFLSQLERNNDRDWFQPRKEEFERLLKEPMLRVVEKCNSALLEPAPNFITDPAKAVHRIYRDTRFSKNKAPYKSHVSALLHDRRLGKEGGAQIYFHVSPTEYLIAGGIYMAPPETLLPVRTHIAAKYNELESVLNSRPVRTAFGDLKGEKLTRPPKGFASDHPAIEFLKHKHLVLETTLDPEEALKKNAVTQLTKRILAMVPFLEFLNAPLIGNRKRTADPLLSRF